MLRRIHWTREQKLQPLQAKAAKLLAEVLAWGAQWPRHAASPSGVGRVAISSAVKSEAEQNEAQLQLLRWQGLEAVNSPQPEKLVHF